MSLIRQLYLRIEVVDLSEVSAHVPSDPDDSPIPATLIATGADYLISGDKDLLSLREKYPIESPAESILRLW